MDQRTVRRASVYCASSDAADRRYYEAAREVGHLMAKARIQIVYGGGGSGMMGALADGALDAGGEVFGVLPRFLAVLEKGHPRLTRLDLVEDMRVRKHKMLEHADAAVGLPGGCGTLEEIFEVLTLKRLGIFHGAVLLLDTKEYFAPLIELLAHAQRERFMDRGPEQLLELAATPDELVERLMAHEPTHARAEGHAFSH